MWKELWGVLNENNAEELLILNKTRGKGNENISCGGWFFKER